MLHQDQPPAHGVGEAVSEEAKDDKVLEVSQQSDEESSDLNYGSDLDDDSRGLDATQLAINVKTDCVCGKRRSDEIKIEVDSKAQHISLVLSQTRDYFERIAQRQQVASERLQGLGSADTVLYDFTMGSSLFDREE